VAGGCSGGNLPPEKVGALFHEGVTFLQALLDSLDNMEGPACRIA
jgi:hypothetical protein